jgi:DNA-binding NarL/FixJ family response regulator
MAIQPSAAATYPRGSGAHAGAAAVLARDPELRRRIAVALAADGIVTVEMDALETLLHDAAGDRRWNALVLAWDLDSALVLLRELRQRVGEHVATVIVEPEPSNARLLHRALRAQLDGFVLESQIAAALGPTVRAVMADQIVVPRRERRQLLPDALSHREKEVIAMVVLGYANGEIAERLFLAESTVKSHLTSAFTKLGVVSRSEAAALVLDPRESVGRAILAAHPALRHPRSEMGRR